MLVPMKTFVLLLCLGFATALECTDGQISCANYELCVPYRYLCDDHSNCADGSDEDPGFCSAWRNTDCAKGEALCRTNGASECIPIENYCHRTQPPCEGTLDRRICSILEAGILGTFGNCPFPYIEVDDQCIVFFSTENLKWDQARAFCEDSGGQLFSIQNANQYYHLARYLLESKFTSDFWLGGRYERDFLSWVWLDGNPMPLGTPFWSLRCYNVTVGGNAAPNEVCHQYGQAPENRSSDFCAAITYGKHYYISDENCLEYKGAICVTRV